MTGIIQQMAGYIDKMPVIGNQGKISGLLFTPGKTNVHFGKDWVSWLNKAPQKGGLLHALFNVALPGPIRPLLGKAVHAFCNLPMMKRISVWAQLMVGFDAMMGVFSALKETKDKGISAGVRSLTHSALLIGAYVTGSFAVPAALGLSVLNMSGILTGILGGRFLHQQAQKLVGEPQMPPLPAVLTEPEDNPFQAEPTHL